MVFTYEGWTLFCKDVKLKGGKIQTIYFFSRGRPKGENPVIYPAVKLLV